ncbi:MAG: hypothetical protein A2431_01115 [Candidatus Zambryskibacteria bacterium RIFOXYC1_FULL_39_10]|uniref:Ribulose-phosphate 3-epimerase n=1 Tax=Candidatus Zambryskibacteria bacterium RIFOXYC1_FULL_39_10 TaxID=1802779 RepID=A0A1G2V2I7_9BACT|nr:MAG: hypothetical protein A2431_01115 [Candidatus Zambryskibacteria bacterium RIFOXYC1_FULL_39_10]OHB16899.1 MAG: hypothetical protein A2605_00325 [Candidatus Zambryskibacteria bacterium RIFOXYD1_FULL_39_35]
MIEIIPSTIPQNLNIVRERFGKILGMAKKVQIDIVDGNYAPSKTWPFNGNQFEEMMKIVREEEKFPYIDEFVLEIDMLVLHPIEYISDFISLGAKSFVIHIDSTDHVEECIETIKSANCEIGLGVKPSGDISVIESFLPELDFVQFMGNDRVGYNGVDIDENVVEMIKNFHHSHSSVPIQIDIGVNQKTIPTLKDAGVFSFVSSSSIFNAPDVKEALTNLQSL